MNLLSHIAPDHCDIIRNKAMEPEGERLRYELTSWLEKNNIVSVFLDTEHHRIQIDVAPKLPPRIKSVLTAWGSIYVRDDQP